MRWGLTTLFVVVPLAGDGPSDAREPLVRPATMQIGTTELVALPPVTTSAATLDDVIRRRRSVRSFGVQPVSLQHVGQLCWAAQGITDPSLGLRASPSAGALFPLELYVVLPSGVFHYEPRGHRLRRIDTRDRRDVLARAALGQDPVRAAGVDFVITAALSRTRVKYAGHAERYVQLEAGHAAENLLLEATALGLGAVPIGAFDEGAARATISASAEETPLYVIAAGHLNH